MDFLKLFMNKEEEKEEGKVSHWRWWPMFRLHMFDSHDLFLILPLLVFCYFHWHHHCRGCWDAQNHWTFQRQIRSYECIWFFSLCAFEQFYSILHEIFNILPMHNIIAIDSYQKIYFFHYWYLHCCQWNCLLNLNALAPVMCKLLSSL